jgi:hypothetical protein
MKRKPLKRFAATLACTLLAVPVWLAANNEKHDADHQSRLQTHRWQSESDMKAMIDLRRQPMFRAFLGRLFLFLAALAWSGISVNGQEITRQNPVYLLPPPTGEPLTLVPNNMPDINCSILEWKNDSPKPTLSVLCPPQDTFAPVYLFLKLSWLKSEDVPSSVRGITARAHTVTKIRTTKSAAWVWLAVKEKSDAAPRGTWIAFGAVANIALLTLPPKR